MRVICEDRVDGRIGSSLVGPLRIVFGSFVDRLEKPKEIGIVVGGCR